MNILLVNPPVYDFAAYDFWLRPCGLLEIAGFLRGRAWFRLFDYMDRSHDFYAGRSDYQSDRWGRGRFYCEKMPLPDCLSGIPRYYRRFGLPRELFQRFLQQGAGPDFVFVQTMMTYWYPGVREVVEDVRRFAPGAKIVLGGNYATLCADHAAKTGADLVVRGTDLDPLWDFLGVEPDFEQPGLWEETARIETGVLKLTQGCPFECTYCSVAQVYGVFRARSLRRSIAELELLLRLGAQNIAFYDDSLLFRPGDVLVPFLEEVLSRDWRVNFHSPNALNARFLTPELAQLMVRAGFRTFYLGFESSSTSWQRRTGGKVFSEELASAVENLRAAGAESANITAYQILGHPDADLQELEDSLHFVASLEIRGMLADFSPIPGTPDGDRCGQWVDMQEPLMHNKTAFPIIKLGFAEVNRLKNLQLQLNRAI